MTPTDFLICHYPKIWIDWLIWIMHEIYMLSIHFPASLQYISLKRKTTCECCKCCRFRDVIFFDHRRRVRRSQAPPPISSITIRAQLSIVTPDPFKKQTLESSLKWQELPEAIEMIFWRWCMTSHYWQGGGSMASRSRSRAFGLLSFQNSQLKLHVVSISGHRVLSSSLSCLDIP